MKTTVELPDDLLERAKAAAAREGSSVKALIEEGLRKVLREREEASNRFQLRRVTVTGQGINPIFADSWEAIREAIYE